MAIFLNGKHLDASIHVGEVYPASIGGEEEAGEAQLALFVGFEDLFRHGFSLSHIFCGEGNALPDATGNRVQNDEFMGLA